MFAQRPTVFAEIIVEEAGGRELAIPLVNVDMTDKFAAEKKEVIQVTTDGRASEFFHADQIHDEGLEFLEQLLAIAQVALVDLPGVGPGGHEAKGLPEGFRGRGGGIAPHGLAGTCRMRWDRRHDAHHVTEPLLSLQGICL
jgi:hypothetical protein